jgi:hypothetical protein
VFSIQDLVAPPILGKEEIIFIGKLVAEFVTRHSRLLQDITERWVNHG